MAEMNIQWLSGGCIVFFVRNNFYEKIITYMIMTKNIRYYIYAYKYYVNYKGKSLVTSENNKQPKVNKMKENKYICTI